MTVLLIVQAWNQRDPVRGFIVPWVRALAREVDRVVVIALEQCHEADRRNIVLISLGKERASRVPAPIRYLFSWHRAMRAAFLHRPDAIITHMTPLYSIAAYPYALWRRVPIITWFLHPTGGVVTRLAHYASRRIVSATRASYPYPDAKVIPIGHMVDADFFCPSAAVRRSNAIPIIAVGRITPIKRYELFIEAIALLAARGIACSAAIIGSPITIGDHAYETRLRALCRERGIERRITFVPAVTRDMLRDWYRQAHAHVNCTVPGSGDKVIIEAMACGTPSIACTPVFNRAYGPHAPLLFCPESRASFLADRIAALCGMPADRRAGLAAHIRRAVCDCYALRPFCRRLVSVAYEAASHTSA